MPVPSSFEKKCTTEGTGDKKMGEKGKPLLDFFVCMSEAMMTITTWVIYMAPVGVFFLIGGQILEMDDFGTEIHS